MKRCCIYIRSAMRGGFVVDASAGRRSAAQNIQSFTCRQTSESRTEISADSTSITATAVSNSPWLLKAAVQAVFLACAAKKRVRNAGKLEMPFQEAIKPCESVCKCVYMHVCVSQQLHIP